MLTSLHYITQLRPVLPVALTVSIAPPYLSIWCLWRLVSTVLPAKIYHRVDDWFYDAYQTVVVFFFETYAGTELIFYGDEIPWDHSEKVLYLSNHQSTVDWAVVDMLAIRQGSLGHIRYILKDSLKYLPLYGFYFPQHGCIYVKRRATTDVDHIQRNLKKFKEKGLPLWLVIFPEGTRFNVEDTKKQKESQEFARKRGLPCLQHHLTPRTKATEVALKSLGDHIDAVYDITIAYKDKHDSKSDRQRARSLFEFLQNVNQQIHIHIRRTTPDRIPQDEEKRKKWIFDSFVLKDRLLGDFYSRDLSVCGKFPGKARRRVVPLRRTLSRVLFWASILAPILTTKYGRSLYWRSWLYGSFATIIYMGVLHERLRK